MNDERKAMLADLKQKLANSKASENVSTLTELGNAFNRAGCACANDGDRQTAKECFENALFTFKKCKKLEGTETAATSLALVITHLYLIQINEDIAPKTEVPFETLYAIRKEADSVYEVYARVSESLKDDRGIESQRILANAYAEVGDRLKLASDGVGADDAYLKAMALLTRISKVTSSAADYALLASTMLSDATIGIGKPDMQKLRSAHEIFQSLHAGQPGQVLYQRKIASIEKIWQQWGLCTYCGGELKGILRMKCTSCGKPKSY